MKISARTLLVSTALTLPIAGSAFAQQIEINPDQLSGRSNECQVLDQVIADNDGRVGDLAARDVVAAINGDAVDQCATYVEELKVFFADGAEDVTTTRGDPTVQIVQNEQDPQVQINDGGEPTVSYLGSDPEVDIQFAQEPSIEIIQSGQPVVIFETLEEREQRRGQR